MSYITKQGDIVEKQDLISEIESLLNTLPSTNADSRTTLSPAVMNALSCKDLEQIRDSLLHKQGHIVENNKEWLLGLVDSAESSAMDSSKNSENSANSGDDSDTNGGKNA